MRPQPLRLLPVGLLLLTVVYPVASAHAKPGGPPPPPNVRKFPPPSSKPPETRIIRLKPGQKRISMEELRKAPTADVANQRGKTPDAKPSFPKTLGVPGARRIPRQVFVNPPAKTAPATKSDGKPGKVKPRSN